ncbi:hypothetical protein KAH27_01200 [bacterium]|nr:hypothetical protein [bacterium]
MKKIIKKTIVSILFTAGLFTGVANGIEKKLPEKVEIALGDIITSGKIDTKDIASEKNIQILYDFIVSAANDGNLWKMKPRRKANGAVLIKSYEIPFEKVLGINLDSELPDAAFFYGVLRHSKKINLSPECKKFFTKTSKRLSTNEVLESSYLSTESITPNIQSGAYYTYTNTRTVTRANVNGTEMQISISDMIGPSTFSMRGIPVGPVGDGVFYYSEKPGMNMTGVTWIKSQMYISSTITVYLETPDKRTAVAMFSWQSAGWKGMNIIKSYHIYTVLEDTFKTFGNVFGNNKVNSKKARDIVRKVKNMNSKEKNAIFEKYCDYVKKWGYKKPTGLNRFKKSTFTKIFDEKSLTNMKQDYIDILIIQEAIRTLIGEPTWSTESMLKIVGNNTAPGQN